MKNLLLATPRISEKAYILAQTGTYTFVVEQNVGTNEVAKYVAEKYSVKVIDARAVNVKPKTRRRYSRGKYIIGKTTSFKKVYVRLAKDQKIPVYDSLLTQNADGAVEQATEEPKKKGAKE